MVKPNLKIQVSDRWWIVNLHLKEGLSISEISKKTGFRKKNVQRWINRYKSDGNVEDVPRSGRKLKLNLKQQKTLKKIMKKNKRNSGNKVKLQARKNKIYLSIPSIHNYAEKFGIKRVKPRRKPLLKPEHIWARLNFAKTHLNDDMKDVIFSDEKTFLIGQYNGFFWLSEDEESFLETEKHPQKIHCWWSFNFNHKNKPYIFSENLNGELYCTILDNRLEAFILKNWGRFQQDNDPKHKCNLAKNWFFERNIELLEPWPAQSPDLNPIENCWRVVSDFVNSKEPQNLKDLAQFIEEGCASVKQIFIKNCINSIPERLREVIKNKGGHTRY
jgi:transposase